MNMRLLRYDDRGELCLTKDLSGDQIPRYAILSHTWGNDEDEISLQELNSGPDKIKAGYKKLQLCGEQARKDNLDHFWADTCCIDKTSSSDLSKNLNSMFQYYQESVKCYVYLSDVKDTDSQEEFRDSRWFKRGWTLQELLAPGSVEFFSFEWEHLGSKATLEASIQKITQIPVDALRGKDLAHFDQDERMRWTIGRNTKEKEDKAYCLSGIFGVWMSPRYGEGESAALTRLNNKIRKSLKPTSQAIDIRIREYYLSDGRLDIERLSGERLPMDSCFINLAIVDALHRREHGRDTSGQYGVGRDINAFTLATRLKIETAQQADCISLKTLFDSRKLIQGIVGRPRRILIWGRAGMGKTTLCKKIVYDFLHDDLWQDLYDRIFWIPLRRLKMMSNETKTVAQMVHEICFHAASDNLLPVDTISDVLGRSTSRCLFILDGLDEISDTIDQDSPMGGNLYKLLKQENVIITSRPHSNGVLQRVLLDVEFETVGFFSEQVEEFLRKEAEQRNTFQISMSAIQSFLKSRPIVQSLLRIPVQLDAICYVWDQDYFQQGDMTMTLLYQAISNRLWQKDIVRLAKKFDGQNITSQQARSCANIRTLVEREISCLEELAFAGLHGQFADFSAEHLNVIAGGQIPFLDGRLSKLSFLRSSERPSKSIDQTRHFIHLTFQEFFAAQYFVRHWLADDIMVFPNLTTALARNPKRMNSISPATFVQQEKYSTRYDIFWRFVAGLIQVEGGDEALDRFFEAIQTEPCDELGVTHQLLIVRCLNEVTGSESRLCTRMRELEFDFQKWTVFASDLSFRGSEWIKLAECPNSVLKSWLRGSTSQKAIVMWALTDKPSIASDLFSIILNEAQDSDSYTIKRGVLAVIVVHCDQLSEQVFSNVFASYDIQDWARICSEMPRGRQGQLLQEKVAQLLHNKNSSTLCYAMQVLEGCVDLPASAVSALVPLIHYQQNDSKVSSAAIDLLRCQKTLPEPVIETLLRHLLDQDQAFENWYKEYGIGWSTDPFEINVNTIVRIVQGRGPKAQCKAIFFFRWRNGVPVSTIEAISSLLQDHDRDVRDMATEALTMQANLPGHVLQNVVDLLQDHDCMIRVTAVEVLGKMSNLPEYAVQNLAKLLQHPDSFLQSRAAEALEKQDMLPDFALEGLGLLLQGQTPDVFKAAVRAIATTRKKALPKPVIDTLISLLRHPDVMIQRGAIWTCDILQVDLPDEIIEIVIPLLSDPEQEETVRYRAARLVETFSALPRMHLDSIVQLLKSEDLSGAAANVLEVQTEFYDLIPSLNVISIKHLIMYWLQWSLSDVIHRCAIFHDDTFLIDIDGTRRTVKFTNREECDIFKQKWRDAQRALGVPLRDSAREMLPEPPDLEAQPLRAGRKKRKRARRG